MVSMSRPARPPWNVRSRLRDATRREHGAVDAAFSRFDLSRAGEYAAFLSRQAAAHLPTERALDQAGAGTILPDWAARRRAGLLEADLAELGVARPAPIAPPVFDTEAALLGGLYVLEGSRLGAAVLRRRLAAETPARFLAAASPQGAWPGLLTLLEERLSREGELDEAVGAARAVFRCFELAGSREVDAQLD
jgi:heme oxygenase